MLLLLAASIGSCSSSKPDSDSEPVERLTQGIKTDNACSLSEVDGQRIVETTVRSDRIPGMTLHQVLRSRPMQRLQSQELSLDSVVKLGNKQVLRYLIEMRSDGSIRVSFDYGSPFRGIRRAVATTSTDQTTFTAEIDGRPTMPAVLAPNTQLYFTDGTPVPNPEINPQIHDAMVALFGKGGELLNSCGGETMGDETAEPLGPVLRATSVPGHTSEPELSFACLDCMALCSGGGTVCITGVVLASPVCGPFVLVCALVGAAGCAGGAIACADYCETEACCPVGCGLDCCDAGESCLNPIDST
ncbi:MAG TPA: hypothetical protein VM686_37160, partial [Polyangiaceae bacterium]|nr:hypothetical protein [Polyangiaceae bacterium]